MSKQAILERLKQGRVLGNGGCLLELENADRSAPVQSRISKMAAPNQWCL